MYSTILVALDGSADSLAGGQIGLSLAGAFGARVLATHVYDARIHTTRFREMEPGLPTRYQDGDTLRELRDSHDTLITHGFQALSHGYMDTFLAEARHGGAEVAEVVAEGRNYVALLELVAEHGPGLVTLGATGIGAIGDGQLGSTAARVLRRAACDVLIARPSDAAGPILVGLDGSDTALAALRKGAAWARALDRPLRTTAAYDTDFHHGVFRTMARSLTPEQQAEVGLDKQDGLHETFIDGGLQALYQTFLDQAEDVLGPLGVEAEQTLVQGKAYAAMLALAAETGASLTIVGRYGHHRQPDSDLGSNAEAITRLSPGSVLVAAAPHAAEAPGERKAGARAETPSATGPLAWDDDALARLERVPGFARPMARRGVEEFVRSQGGRRVTLAEFLVLARRLGMAGPEEARGE